MKQEESILGPLFLELFWSVGFSHTSPDLFYETEALSPSSPPPLSTSNHFPIQRVPVSNWGCSHAGAVIGQIKSGSMPLPGRHRFILLLEHSLSLLRRGLQFVDFKITEQRPVGAVVRS